METMVRTVELSKIYRIRSEKGIENVVALNRVNMEISRGETFGVIGESGSGKTTLGKTIMRLIEPTGGKIYMGDTDITDLNEKRLRKIRGRFQIVFQDPYKSLNPRMSVGAAVAEASTGNLTGRQRTDRAKELLEKVGISSRKYGHFPHQFSGGERQRIAIARALSTEPELLVCDEPTSNLDLSIQAKILNLLTDLREEFGLTYLFISHNLQVVRFMADRVGVMLKGEMIETGPVLQVMENPVHPYTKRLVGSIGICRQDMGNREMRSGKLPGGDQPSLG